MTCRYDLVPGTDDATTREKEWQRLPDSTVDYLHISGHMLIVFTDRSVVQFSGSTCPIIQLFLFDLPH